MRLNLGCGSDKLPGWLNVDKFATLDPDQMVDLEVLPWPWPNDSVDEVLLSHVLEHLGAKTEVYLDIIKELYRVCRDGAKIKIVVPHPRHNDFLHDPTHVRPITPTGLKLFSQAANREMIAAKHGDSPLGLYLGVDFRVEKLNWFVDPRWSEKVERNEISKDDLAHAMLTYNNVVKQISFVIVPIKPAGRAERTVA